MGEVYLAETRSKSGAYEAKGMYDQAVDEYTKSAAAGGDFTPEDVARMKDAYAQTGPKGYLQTALSLNSTRFVPIRALLI